MTGFRRDLSRSTLLSLLALLIAVAGSEAAEVGTTAQNLQLVDPAGGTRPLAFYADKIVVLVFWAFKCPVALAYNSRFSALQSKYSAQGIELVVVDPNQNETPEEIKQNTNNLNLSFKVWIDSDGALAESLAITHIPAVVVLDKGMVVRYSGSLDNNKAIGEHGRIAYVEDALNSLIARKPVAIPETRFFGCATIRSKAP